MTLVFPWGAGQLGFCEQTPRCVAKNLLILDPITIAWRKLCFTKRSRWSSRLCLPPAEKNLCTKKTLKTNMTIKHPPWIEWRCISYGKWVFSNVGLVFRDVPHKNHERWFLSSPKWVTIHFLQPKKRRLKKPRDVLSPTRRAKHDVFFFFFGQTAQAPEKGSSHAAKQRKLWQFEKCQLLCLFFWCFNLRGVA